MSIGLSWLRLKTRFPKSQKEALAEPILELQQQASKHFDQFQRSPHLSGKCNICGNHTVFFYEHKALYRESLTCAECLTTSRYRSIARGILQAVRELSGVEAKSIAELNRLSGQVPLRVYDTQVPFQNQTND